MNKLFRALYGTALLGLSLMPCPAYAASFKVAVQQLNPNSAPQTVTCTSKCTLPLVINAGTASQQTVNITIIQTSSVVLFNFQQGSQYFYSNDTGSSNPTNFTVWGKSLPTSKPMTYGVTLFTPLVLATVPPIPPTPKGASQSMTHSPVANLQVTITPGS